MVTPPPLSPIDLPSHRRRPSSSNGGGDGTPKEDSGRGERSSISSFNTTTSESEEVEQFFDPIDEPEVHIQTYLTTDGHHEERRGNEEHGSNSLVTVTPASPALGSPGGADFTGTSVPLVKVTTEERLGALSLEEEHAETVSVSPSPLAIVAKGQQEEDSDSNSVSGEQGGGHERSVAHSSSLARPSNLTINSAAHASGLHPLSELATTNRDTAWEAENDRSDLSSDDDESRTITTTTTTASRTLSTSSAGPRSIVLPTGLAGGESLLRSVRTKSKKKTTTEFGHLYLIQELRRTPGPGSQTAPPIYAARFSPDGNYLAMAGEDGVITVWKLLVDDTMALMAEEKQYVPPRLAAIFQQEPAQLLYGHEGPILDISWSKNNFLLSASMDRTVRLWHHSRDDCLGVFKHPDFVTSVAFHPRDDRLFITGSLDCRLRLWSIAERAVRAWNELPPNNFVTAVAFNTSGKLALAGTSTGVCLVFETEGFNYSTQIHVHSRRGRNKTGKKICSIEAMPGNAGEEKILISTNDSRVRLYTLQDKSLISKFIGHTNESSQIRATFSDDGEYVISGSEDARIVIWNAEPRYQKRSLFWRRGNLEQVRACEWWEAHSRAVTVAIFAPSTVKNRLQSVGLRPVLATGTAGDSLASMAEGAIIVAADLNGKVKVYESNVLLESWLKG